MRAKYMPGSVKVLKCDDFMAPGRDKALSRGIGIGMPNNGTPRLMGAGI